MTGLQWFGVALSSASAITLFIYGVRGSLRANRKDSTHEH